MTKEAEMPWPEIAVATNHADALAAWINMQRAVEVAQAAMSQAMEAEGGCSLLEHQALFHVATSADQRLSMRLLADALATSASGATRLVDRLVKRDWLKREHPEHNRRQTDAVLTSAGKKAFLNRTRPAFHKALDECFGSLCTERDLGDARRIGRRVLEGHDRYDIGERAWSE